MRFSLSTCVLAVQAMLAVPLLAVAVLMPPARGFMLAVPVAGAAPFPNWAIARGARLVASGGLPGSLVIEGSRARLLPTALRHGFILIAADPALCGAAGAPA